MIKLPSIYNMYAMIIIQVDQKMNDSNPQDLFLGTHGGFCQDGKIVKYLQNA